MRDSAARGDGADPFASLFDFLPIGAYRALPDGTLLRANRALVELNGYASEAELLAAWRDSTTDWYVDPQQRARFQAALDGGAGEVRALVSQVRRQRTRDPIWVSENAHPVRDAAGALLYYDGTVEDITARVDAAEALARSNRELREITARVPGVVYRLRIARDGRQRYTFVSDGVRELFGVEPDTMLGADVGMLSYAHPDDRDRVLAEVMASRRDGVPVRTECRILLPDGTVKWIQLASSSGVREDGEDGEDAVRVGVMLDISARKRAELALRDSEARWKLALEGSGNGVWDWDLVSGVEVVSPQLLALYGLDPLQHDNRPQTLDALIHPDDLAAMLVARNDHLQGRSAGYVNEHRLRHADGRWIWVLSRGLVIDRDAAGRPLRMIGTHTDISGAKEAESLRLERDRSAAAQKAQTAFLSRVSHELRTPLNAIIGFAQLLELEGVGSERQRGWVRTVLNSGRHLLALVNDLLDLSSAQTGQLQFTSSAVDLAVLLREAWTMHAADAAAAAVTFIDTLPAAGSLAVQCDPTRLKQVLSNLLSNAIKYNRRDGSITVSAARHGARVLLTVQDTGNGIDDAQRARLFNPFERVGAQHSQVSGTGLGLALSKQLLEAMDGAVDVESTPGVGSTFSVQLPAARAAAAAINAARI